MVDALDTISWFSEEVWRPAVDGLLDNLDVVVQGRSFLIGDCQYCLTEAMMDQDPSRGYDELDGEERFVVMQKAYHTHQIVRRLKDQTETVGEDSFGSLGLADIIVMLSLLCALHDDGLMDAMRLDSTWECYDVLGRECFRLCVGPEGCDDRSGSFRSMYRRLSSGEGFDELDTTFDRLEDVLVDSVIHRLAIEFGTADDGDLPADYLVEDMVMGLQDRYSDVVESSLGGRGDDAGRELDR